MRKILPATMATCLFALASCYEDDASGPLRGSENVVEYVVVTPNGATLARGDTVVFAAVARDSSGNALDRHVFTWSSSDSSVVTLSFVFGTDSAAASFRAVGAGTALVRALTDGRTGTASVTVP
jgi:uncharacterized protein YjdB